MSLEANEKKIRQMFEVAIPNRDEALAESLFHPDYVDHDPLPGQPAGTAAGPYIVRTVNEHARAAGAPGARPVIDEVVSQGDRVAVRWHTGGIRVFAFFRVQDGLIAERWALLQRAA